MRIHTRKGVAALKTAARGVSAKLTIFRTFHMPYNENNYKEELMYKTDCPNCHSAHTFPTPETAFERFCADCDEVYDIRPIEEQNEY